MAERGDDRGPAEPVVGEKSQAIDSPDEEAAASAATTTRAERDGAALEVEQVLREEAKEVHCLDDTAAKLLDGKTGTDLNRALNDLESCALCLSGGGIRSASFALGVIQALAIHPRSGSGPVASGDKSLLARFHFLSTVSGGGYIGSWLSAWRKDKDFADIWSSLVKRPGGPATQPPPIAWLYSFSNYLTPKAGTLSADTWAATALWVRNLVLNWLLILPSICAAILLIKLLGLASTWVILWGMPTFPAWDGTDPAWFYLKVGLQVGAGVGAFGALVVALVLTMRARPGCNATPDRPDQAGFLRGTLFWSVLSAFLLVNFLASDLVGMLLLECKPPDPPTPLLFGWLAVCREHISPLNDLLAARHGLAFHMAVATIPGVLAYACAWLLARRWKIGLLDFLAWTVSGAVYGAMVAVALYAYLIIPDEGFKGLQVYFMHLSFGVPWILLSQTLADMVFVGLSSFEPESDADREWFGRSAGWFLAIEVAWLSATFLVFFGTILRTLVEKDLVTSLQGYIPIIAGVSGVVTALFGKSSAVPVKGETRGLWSYIASLIVPFAAVVFVAALTIVISFLLDRALFGESLMPEHQQDIAWGNRFIGLLVASGVAAGLIALTSTAININRFSLHAMYRNRLTRAFLGAARDREPDPFTDFDSKDNPEMHLLWPQKKSGGWRPFHVINIALNIVSSEQRLAWQERKAASFTVSPLHSGSSVVKYRNSSRYGGPTGITLGTAMAISGAAASPNMGYHSSPAITFLMTLFNVRLGWWLGNPGDPGDKTYDKLGPAFAITPLVQEALGLTTASRSFVYLSDGGHFENLGLYEMVRRRCRFIVVSDAGCDPKFALEDLSNAVRKVAIDLGVEIRFFGLESLKPRNHDAVEVRQDQPYHAVGEIDYAGADGGGTNGYILYIKAGYHGSEGAGVRGYANAHPDFPHQSTTDQWFTESQFESYRALGFEITDGLLRRALADPACGADPRFETIFRTLHNNCSRPMCTN